MVAAAADPSAAPAGLPGRWVPGYARGVIVVVGDPVLRPFGDGDISMAAGSAATIARACVQAGGTVQLAGKVGDDAAGNEILLSLSRDGIGHVALLRDAGLATRIEPAPTAATVEPDLDAPSVDAAWAIESADDDASVHATPVAQTTLVPEAGPSALAPEDLDLALRYLVTFSVLVVAEPLTSETLAVAAEAAAFSGAHLVIAAHSGDTRPLAGDVVTVLEPPRLDPDGDFADLVARYALALDNGTTPAAAFRAALGGSSWEPATT